MLTIFHLIDEKHIMFTGTIGQISSIVLARISFLK